MYLGHSHLCLLLLLEELLLEQLEAVLGGQRGDGGRGAGAARAEQLLGAGQVEGEVFGILGTKKWAGECSDWLRLGCGFWFPTVLTPAQQRSPCARGTQGVLRGSLRLSALHICGIPRTVFQRGFSQRAGRAALAVSGEGESPGLQGRTQQGVTQTLHTFPCRGCPGWAVSWCLEHLPAPAATALPAAALLCLGSARRNAGKPGLSRHKNESHGFGECLSVQLFPGRPCERYCCVS